MSLAAVLGHSAMRFAIAGTLITLYLVVDARVRRLRRAPASPASPAWVKWVGVLSLAGFYLLIRPTGRALLAGFGNLAGISLAAAAMALRASSRVRHPDLAGRALLYLALPIATGVPWGLLVLSLPAWITSAYCSLRAGRIEGFAAVRAPRHRLLPGIW
jgi:protein-S-isoprenylcysteine O-methyltransferase Ste14